MAGPAPEEAVRVSSLELFFDLVFVFTVTQLTTVLVDRPDLAGLARVVIVLALVFYMYGGYAWLTNAIAVDRGRATACCCWADGRLPRAGPHDPVRLRRRGRDLRAGLRLRRRAARRALHPGALRVGRAGRSSPWRPRTSGRRSSCSRAASPAATRSGCSGRPRSSWSGWRRDCAPSGASTSRRATSSSATGSSSSSRSASRSSRSGSAPRACPSTRPWSASPCSAWPSARCCGGRTSPTRRSSPRPSAPSTASAARAPRCAPSATPTRRCCWPSSSCRRRSRRPSATPATRSTGPSPPASRWGSAASCWPTSASAGSSASAAPPTGCGCWPPRPRRSRSRSAAPCRGRGARGARRAARRRLCGRGPGRRLPRQPSSQASSARAARPRWLIASFSSGASSAIVRPSATSSGRNAGS